MSETSHPTAANVLSLFLATAARGLLLNDEATLSSPGTDLAAPTNWTPAEQADGASSPQERVHQSRVNLRRLRATLRVFSNLFDRKWSTQLAADLRWYANEMGVTRDLDVVRARLVTQLHELHWTDSLSDVVRDLDATLARSRQGCDDVRRSDRSATLRRCLVDLEISAPFTHAAHQRATRVIPRLVVPTWLAAEKAAQRAQFHDTVRSLHLLRIELKRAQFSAELLEHLELNRSRRLVRVTEALQSRLGHMHDSAVTIEWLAAIEGSNSTVAAKIAALVEIERQKLFASREGWYDDWRGVRNQWHRCAKHFD